MQRALDGVYGVDINPFAAAIAQFRLLVTALRASHIERLIEAPNYQIHIAAGDSLLHGRRFDELDIGTDAGQLANREEFNHAFRAEDLDELNRILGQQYHVVVGNPPYVTVKDAALNRLYRTRYSTCHMKYALSVPFTERFFDLALGDRDRQVHGHVGMITANSFMKREFGKKLIEEFLPSLELTHVLDTSGAYIPGHGTPTVILLGRRRDPIVDSVRCVMGIRGEPSTPADPSQGLVWTAIVNQSDKAGSESEWVSVANFQRRNLDTHPWSLGGGGVQELQEMLDSRAEQKLGDIAVEIGITAVTGEDGLFIVGDSATAARLGVDRTRNLIVGDSVRDWAASSLVAVWLYDGDFQLLDLKTLPSIARYFWRYRTAISSRKRFGTRMLERGLTWYEYQELYTSKLRTPFSITFGEVATHNHFALARGESVFKQTAPVIKLLSDVGESDYMGLVGLLNSAVACFWMKQVSHNKGSTVDARGARQTTDAFENFYQFNATKLKKFPLPNAQPLYLAETIDCLANERQTHLPGQLAERFPITPAELNGHRDTAANLLARMVALQEELDWECYRLYGVIDEDRRYIDDAGNLLEPPPLALGERGFEIVMARRMAAGELETTWFTRHGSSPITEPPAHWPADYRALVERRIDLIETDRSIGLLERPEYKRRWNIESWKDQERRALRSWLFDRLESPAYWPETRLATVRTLAERATVDTDFQRVAERYAGHAGANLETLVAELVESASVPALPLQRYKSSGLAKRADWERTWALQRREDEIDAEVAAATPRLEDESETEHAARLQAEQRRRKQEEVGDLLPPPKYRSGDFLKPAYWRLRGALDVPKERFVSLPQMSRDSDPTPLVGWAGWNTLELCQTIAAYYAEATEQEGWTASRLTPILAVLQENLAYLKQWHNDMDPNYNLRLGDFFETYLHSQLSTHGLTADDLREWISPNISHVRVQDGGNR